MYGVKNSRCSFTVVLHFAFWSSSQNSWIIFRIKSEPRPLDNAHLFPRCNIAKYYTAKAL